MNRSQAEWDELRRTARDRERRAQIIRILSREGCLCLDCGSARFRVSNDGQRIELYHLRTCPGLRSAWSKRATDNYLRALLIMGGMHRSAYGSVHGWHVAVA